MAAPKGNEFAKGCTTSGQPTKYSPEFPEKLIAFFGATEEAFEQIEDNKGSPHLVGKAIPTFERFAFNIGVCRDTLHRWANAKDDQGALIHKEFSDAYSRAKTYQAALMLEGGMVGALNPSFTGLAMKNLHDWKDKLETENTHSGQIDLAAIESDLAAAKSKSEEWREAAEERINKYST